MTRKFTTVRVVTKCLPGEATPARPQTSGARPKLARCGREERRARLLADYRAEWWRWLSGEADRA